MSTETEKPAPRRRRWMTVALVVSLGVNLMVAGLVGGAILRDGPRERDPFYRDVSALGLRFYYRALPDQARDDLRHRVGERRGDFRAGREALAKHMNAMADAVGAEPFDPARLAGVLADQGRTVAGNMATGQALLVATISAMTPDERTAMAEALRRAPRQR
jgi:uncharacterized membrane protein